MKTIIKILSFTTLVLLVMTACLSQPEEEILPFLDVAVSIEPGDIDVKTPVTFSAKVSYGEEKVTDADKVIFEIWRANDETHEKIEVSHKENGVYSLDKTFEQEGTYYIIAHVTARSMHNMPKEEFVVGTASEPETDEQSSEMDMEETEHTEHSDH